jgi:hypothetical protein
VGAERRVDNREFKMETVRLTVKNYRCFSDQEPLRIEIGAGLTAIVGPNNSGKSAIKLLFSELRFLFQILASPLTSNPNISVVFAPNYNININYQGVSDPEEIFTNGNDRPLVIEIDLIPPVGLRTSPGHDNLVRS